MADLESIKKEYNELSEKFAKPELVSDWAEFEKVSKRKKKLEKILDIEKELDESKKQIEDNKLILASKEDQ